MDVLARFTESLGDFRYVHGRALALAGLLLLVAGAAQAVDRVRWEHDGQMQEVEGEVVVEAEDGGLLVLSPEGRLWAVTPEELKEHSSDDRPFQPLDDAQLTARLQAELPGFQIHRTAHYVICHNTSRPFAQWCGGLFERLYKAFFNFWSQRGFELHEPRFPLVAIVFADAESYRTFARPELGDGVETIIGYYGLTTNRMTLYDLTGVQALRGAGDRRGSAAEINRMLSRPEAERTVATIIHEATHQIAFNCGMHQRLADVPLWVSEGLAVYFESPDLQSTKGWRTIGAVNRVRLAGMRDYLPRRPARSLESLIINDDRFRDARTAGDAYSEAWAFNYFLLRQRPKQYAAYLQALAEKGPLLKDEPETRLSEFRHHFGEDLSALDAEFLRHVAKIK